MRLLSGLILAVAYFGVTSGQNVVGRVRSVSATPTSTYGPACVKSAPKPALPAEEFSSILQLAALLSKTQSPPPPPPPAPTPANNALNSGGIIDKLIDALIITATQKNQPAPAPSSSRLIDIDVLKSLLSLQGASSSSTPAASTATAEPTSVSPASSTVPLSTSSTAPTSSTLLEDASSMVGGNSADNLSSFSTALRSLLNPEK